MAKPKVRASKSVPMEVRVWYGRKDGRIHLASKEHGWISTISDDPNSARYHRNLHRKLKKVLVDAGAWPTTK